MNIRMSGQARVAVYGLLAIAAAIACVFSMVDGAIPQLQMNLLGGQMPIGNILTKLVLMACIVGGLLLDSKIRFGGLPISAWRLCIGYLAFEIGYLALGCNKSLSDVLQSYNAYYLLLLIGPALLVFRGAVSERLIIRLVVTLFLICATIGIAQYLTRQPILYTASADGSFEIQSMQFFDDVRAFSLFSSGLNYGIFCSLCGALGIALARKSPVRGLLLAALSAIACYTTLTRLCYLIFVCACGYSAVMTFGKKPTRGLWHPLIFFVLGIVTILRGVESWFSGQENQLQSAASVIDRIVEWTYYVNLVSHSSLAQQVLGLGIVQNDKVIEKQLAPIDNAVLALVLHIGVIGLIVFGAFMTKIWLYLRRMALVQRRPFVVAAASLWATFACAGTFNIVFYSLGATFAVVVLCDDQTAYSELT